MAPRQMIKSFKQDKLCQIGGCIAAFFCVAGFLMEA